MPMNWQPFFYFSHKNPLYRIKAYIQHEKIRYTHLFKITYTQPRLSRTSNYISRTSTFISPPYTYTSAIKQRPVWSPKSLITIAKSLHYPPIVYHLTKPPSTYFSKIEQNAGPLKNTAWTRDP